MQTRTKHKAFLEVFLLALIFSLLNVRMNAQVIPVSVISTFAGTASVNDGEVATNAFFRQALGVFVDELNDLVYISDNVDNRIRVVNRTSNIITTFAGNGILGFSGDGEDPLSASLSSPYSVAVDSLRNLVYIADVANSRIRVVNRATNKIYTFAGNGIAGFSGDGGDPQNAQLSSPRATIEFEL